MQKHVNLVYLGKNCICYVPSFMFSCFSLWRTFSSMSPFSQSLFKLDPNSNEYLIAKIGVDTAENELLKVYSIKVYLIFKLLVWDLIFTEPPRPERGAGAHWRGRAGTVGNVGDHRNQSLIYS